MAHPHCSACLRVAELIGQLATSHEVMGWQDTSVLCEIIDVLTVAGYDVAQPDEDSNANG